uniref:Uncharacterized protein n=1 Tax=Strongyloides stercoralis TaxID=6248 RepID=A0AAF5DJD8_STRER
ENATKMLLENIVRDLGYTLKFPITLSFIEAKQYVNIPVKVNDEKNFQLDQNKKSQISTNCSSIDDDTLETVSKNYTNEISSVSKNSCLSTINSVNCLTAQLQNIFYKIVNEKKNLNEINNNFVTVGVEIFIKNNIFGYLYLIKLNSKYERFKRKFPDLSENSENTTTGAATSVKKIFDYIKDIIKTMNTINIVHITNPSIKTFLNTVKYEVNTFKEKFSDKNLKTVEQSIILNETIEKGK